MVTENYERICRRLRQHQRKLSSAVTTTADGVEITAWTAWCDERGRLRALRIRMRRAGPFTDVDSARRLAEAYFGGDWLRAYEIIDPQWRTVTYALELDGGALHADLRPLRLPDPSFKRYFCPRVLAAGIGQQDGGRVSWRGQRLFAVPGE